MGLYFGGAGDPSQGIAHANQVLTHEATRLLFLNFLLLWEAETMQEVRCMYTVLYNLSKNPVHHLQVG